MSINFGADFMDAGTQNNNINNEYFSRIKV